MVSVADPPLLRLVARGDREIVMTREFDAPRQLVFDAWTKPELVERWFGRLEGWTTKAEVDLRVGGTYRFTMQDAKGTKIVLRGEYREIERPSRFVTAEAFEGFSETGWRPEDATVTTTVFTERDGRTTWTATSRYPSKEIRNAVLNDPNMQTGMNAGFIAMDAVLRELK
ncbi:MAG: hypothetical protein E6I57_14025 [Chloroflexi bacterium]|nr:MAG: hypothetical protein E6J38_13175 [Chloroflexota bacterium]TMC31460.1 MAG: hypothetical protein E6J27_00225 [Chloroflexota bacterium]TME36543.1 MAG: hypothetical protein E6I57_14025 [Chloroflexota bacterium]